VADTLRAADVLVFGPSKAAAELEASKAFTKEICAAVDAPTAAYGHFTDAEAARAYVTAQGAPIVIKADGLAAGKGVTVLPIGTAQDHKRVGDGDTGPNTGGMGAYSPAPVLTEAIATLALDQIIRPTMAEMARRGMPYQGVLYAGDAAGRTGAGSDVGRGERAIGPDPCKLGRGPRHHDRHGRAWLSRQA